MNTSSSRTKIRPATVPDIPLMAKIIADNFDRAMPEHSPAVREHCKRECAAKLLERQLEWKVVFVILQDGIVAGTGALANFGTEDTPRWSISNFFIRVDLHGQGLGRELLRKLFDEALKLGVEDLHVPSSRTGMKFYQTYGFVQDEVQPAKDRKLEIIWHTRRLSDRLVALLGDEKFALWTRLRVGIEANFGLAPMWNHGGKKWNVECKYRKGGKTLCALYAKEKQAGLLVIFGAAEREKFEATRQEYSAWLQQSYDQATTYHDGKWVMFELTDAQYLPELLRILTIKRKIVKER